MENYIPQDQPSEKQKKFTLAPAADEITFKVIQTRQDIVRNRNLSYPARLLFVHLLDLAMSPYTHVIRGVVVISATKISEELGACRASVFRWIRELIVSRALWISKQFMPNFWAMNTYHISELDPRGQARQLPTRDGLWGNGVRRPEAPARAKKAGGWYTDVHANSEDEISISQQNAPEACNSEDPTGINNGRQRSTNVHATSPQKRTPQVHKSARQRSTKVHASRIKTATGGVHQSAHLKTSKIETEKEIFKGKAASPPPADPVWAKKLSKLYPRELEKMKADLVKQQRAAQQDGEASPIILDLTHRIMLIDNALYGGPVPTKKPGPARALPKANPAEQKPMTPEELLESARYAASVAPKTLTKEQTEALRKAGEL